MSDSFAHQLRLDQVRDGDGSTCRRRGGARAIAKRLGLPRSTGWKPMRRLERNGRRQSAQGAAPRRARAELRGHRRTGRRACRRAVRDRLRAGTGERRAGRGDRAWRGDCDIGFPRRRGDRPRQRDCRHAGAQHRPLSAQRGRRCGAEGSGRPDRGAGEPVRGACQSSRATPKAATEHLRRERRRRGRCRTPPAADATAALRARRRRSRRRQSPR